MAELDIQKTKVGNPDAESVGQMLKVDIPMGVIPYKNELVEQESGGEWVEQFGVKEMLHGRIDARRSNEENSNPVPGLWMRYQPGDIVAKTTRRDLTPEQINHIGKLCLQLQRIRMLQSFLPKTIGSTEKLVGDLRSIPSLDESNLVNIADDKQRTEWVEQMGAILEQMKAAKILKKEEINKIVSELDSLGVASVRDNLLQGMDEQPIAFMAAELELNKSI